MEGEKPCNENKTSDVLLAIKQKLKLDSGERCIAEGKSERKVPNLHPLNKVLIAICSCLGNRFDEHHYHSSLWKQSVDKNWPITFLWRLPQPFIVLSFQVRSGTVTRHMTPATALAACFWSNRTSWKGSCRCGVNRKSTTGAGPSFRPGETALSTSSGTGTTTRWQFAGLPFLHLLHLWAFGASQWQQGSQNIIFILLRLPRHE